MTLEKCIESNIEIKVVLNYRICCWMRILMWGFVILRLCSKIKIGGKYYSLMSMWVANLIELPR